MIGLAVLALITAVIVALSLLNLRPHGREALPERTDPAASEPGPLSTPRAPRDSTIANIRMLLSGPDPVKIVILGDDTGTDQPNGAPSWVTLWARQLSADRPVSLKVRDSAGDGTPTPMGSGGAPPVELLNASNRPGQLSGIVPQAGLLLPHDTDLVIINAGHDESLDTLPRNLDALWAKVPVGAMGLVVIQNPQGGDDASQQRARTIAVKDWAQRNNVAAVDVFNAFIQAPEPLAELLGTDLIHPNERGAEVWRDAMVAALRR